MSNYLDISLVFTPRERDKLNFELLMDKLKKDRQFAFYEVYNDFLIEIYNQEKFVKILVYYDGMINYTEGINNEDISSNKIYIVFKNCITMLRFLGINTQYEKNLGIFIKGKDPNACYEKVIHEFGQVIFNSPHYRNMNLHDDSTYYSVFIKDKPCMNFEF